MHSYLLPEETCLATCTHQPQRDGHIVPLCSDHRTPEQYKGLFVFLSHVPAFLCCLEAVILEFHLLVAMNTAELRLRISSPGDNLQGLSNYSTPFLQSWWYIQGLDLELWSCGGVGREAEAQVSALGQRWPPIPVFLELSD